MINPRGRSHRTRTSAMATSNVSAKCSKLVREICKMEEMRKDTTITKSALVTARYVLSTENGESKEFTNLVDKMNKCFKSCCCP